MEPQTCVSDADTIVAVDASVAAARDATQNHDKIRIRWQMRKFKYMYLWTNNQV